MSGRLKLVSSSLRAAISDTDRIGGGIIVQVSNYHVVNSRCKAWVSGINIEADWSVALELQLSRWAVGVERNHRGEADRVSASVGRVLRLDEDLTGASNWLRNELTCRKIRPSVHSGVSVATSWHLGVWAVWDGIGRCSIENGVSLRCWRRWIGERCYFTLNSEGERAVDIVSSIVWVEGRYNRVSSRHSSIRRIDVDTLHSRAGRGESNPTEATEGCWSSTIVNFNRVKGTSLNTARLASKIALVVSSVSCTISLACLWCENALRD